MKKTISNINDPRGICSQTNMDIAYVVFSIQTGVSLNRDYYIKRNHRSHFEPRFYGNCEYHKVNFKKL